MDEAAVVPQGDDDEGGFRQSQGESARGGETQHARAHLVLVEGGTSRFVESQVRDVGVDAQRREAGDGVSVTGEDDWQKLTEWRALVLARAGHRPQTRDR